MYRVWMRAVRLFSFTASITPVLIGSAFALVDHGFRPIVAILVLLACVLCHAGCNLANDYFDFRKGTDREMLLGRGGVIQDGWLSPGQVRLGMIVAFGLATGLGIIVLSASTWWLLALAVPCLIAAVVYTGGPKPLGYMALGEATVWLAMGMGITCGTYVALTRELTLEVVVGSLGISSLVAAILHVNNLRDFDTDRSAGKRTLAHLLGWRNAVRELDVLLFAAYLFAMATVAVHLANWPVLMSLATIPAALAISKRVRTEATPPSLNPAVRLTAQVHFRYGLLFAAGLVIRAIIDRT
jgi:1,4-dihydroxy-2-naphthoate octaprenyltransferase